MATYNHARFVSQAIDSVLAQTGVSFELVLLDDGSTDGTRDIVYSQRDPRIRVLPSEVNRGAAAALNELVAASRGEYVAIMNSDDYWLLPNKLELQIDKLARSEDVGAVFGRARFVDINGSTIPKPTLAFGDVFDQENRSRGQWMRRLFDSGNCLCHPSVLIRRSVYDAVGTYNNALRQLPDLDMWVRVLKRFDIWVSEEEVIGFRLMPGENASSQTPRNYVRTMNEHHLIAQGFFDGVDAETLLDGFSDLMRSARPSGSEHLDIEKALLYLAPNEALGISYQLHALSRIFELLGSDRHRSILAEEYGIDDKWFHKYTGTVETLRSTPQLTARKATSAVKRLLARIANRYLG